MKVKEILNIVGGELLAGSYETEVGEIKQNSKSITKGDTFIAIEGENTDGHKYINDAIKNGAKLLIISKNEEINKKDVACILVNNTEKALYDIVKYKLSVDNPIIIGVTGSVGKTSTKEALAEVLGKKFEVFKTPKNLNTKRGMSLAIASTDENMEIVVTEMGMDGFGQIAEMSKFFEPNIAIITNVGSSHIGNLGSKENILKAKLEIVDGLKDNGLLILNNDNEMLREYAKKEKQRQINLDQIEEEGKFSKIKRVNIITYGLSEDSDIKIKNIENLEEETKFDLEAQNKTNTYKINTVGKHNIYNVTPAIYIAEMFEMTREEIEDALLNIKSTERRMDRFVTISNILVYDDSYNASYESVVAALDTIKSKKHYGRNVAILGDILELGDYSEEYHKKIAKELIKNNFDVVITAGELTKYIIEEIENENTNIKTYHFKDADEINDNLDYILRTDDVVLIKASNSMNFNLVANKLRKEEVDPAKYK